ncbi:MAG: tetratricopeptide repeat protein, partial [Phycisphaerales bacterium]
LLDAATIDAPVEAPATPAPSRHVDRAAGGEEIGQQIGAFKLLERLGEGGFGTVYLAQQEEPVRRRVALKIIKLGMDTRQVIARFEAERQALAMMDHAGIAKVLDAGATATGRPYFVMELVRGIPVTDYCDRHKLDAKARLELFIEICHAVPHAHQKGVIHRDLKPSNILVAEQDDKPLAKVIDFGIAKATSARLGNQTVYTQQRQLIGTPAYMSPEQADMSGLDIDTRSDIYSLGVILYEILTGAVPVDDDTLQHATFDQVSRILREFEPSKPSTLVRKRGDTRAGAEARRGPTAAHLARELKGDLDWIVMKAIEKDRARRYETANALAMDIERHLRNEPVLAGPPSPVYKFGKFARRNRVALAAASVVFLALVGGLTAAAIGFRSASIERDRAVAARVEAEQARDESEAVTSFLSGMLAAVDPGNSGRDVAVRDVLDVASASIEAALDDNPLVEARLRETMGRTYLELGLIDDAARHLPAAYEIRRSQLGAKDPDTLAALSAMARLAAARGDYPQARRLIEESLNAASQDEARVLDATHQLAVIDFLQARYEPAEAGFRRALEGREALLGPEDRDTLESTRGLARLYREMGRWAEAEPLLVRTLEAQERTLGAEHPETLRTLADLAWLAFRLGNMERTESLYTRTLGATERVLGPDHPVTLGVAADFAQALTDAGRYDQAGAILADRLERFRRVLGADHPDTISSLAALGMVKRRQGDIEGAAAMLDEARALSETALGATHPSTLTTLVNLANVRLEQNRLADAEALLQRALAGQRTALGDDHIDAIATRITLASVLSRMGRSAEAETMYRDAIAACKAALGPDHRNTLVATVNLAILLRGDGQYDEAEALYRDAIGIMERTMGTTHPARLRTMNNLAELLAAVGRLDEAERTHLDTLAMRQQSLGAAHPDTLVSLDNLARLYGNQGRWVEAADMYERTVAALDGRDGGAGLDVLDPLVSLGDAWVAAGQPDRARPSVGRRLETLRQASREPGAPAALLVGAAYTFLRCEPADMQDPASALPIARAAVSATDRRDVDALDLLAESLERTGDATGAADALREAIALLPEGDSRRADFERRLAETGSDSN